MTPVGEVVVTELELGDILALAQLTWENREHIAKGFREPPEVGAQLVGQLTSALASHLAGRSWQGVIRVDGVIVGRVWVVPIPDFGPQVRALLDPSGNTSTLYEVMCWVAADRCGSGAGRAGIVQAVPASRESLGATTLFARIASGNAASLAAFRAAGFQRIGTWREQEGFWLAKLAG